MAKLWLSNMVLLGAILFAAPFLPVQAQQPPVLRLFEGGQDQVPFFVPVGAGEEYTLNLATNTMSSSLVTGNVNLITVTINGATEAEEEIDADAPPSTTRNLQTNANIYEFRLVSTGNTSVTTEQYQSLLSSLRYVSTLPSTSIDDPPRNITVVASGPAGDSEAATALILLLISNQFPPNITLPSSVSVDENTPNGATFAQLSATDPEGLGVTFQTESSVFALSPTGVLSVLDANSLDFETQTSFRFTFTATDTDPIAPMSSEASLTININNVNDNPPQFTSNTYMFSVIEEVANAEVGTVLATDDDRVPNTDILGAVFFEIQDTRPEITQIFNLNRGTGVLTVRPPGLDFESVQSYTFQVSATDGIFMDTATVVVSVIDVPDDRPVISPADKTILINLDINQREVFLTEGSGGPLMVSDSDSQFLQDGEARLLVVRGATVGKSYSLQHPHDIFCCVCT